MWTNPIERMVHGGDKDSPTNNDCSIFPPINHENLPISKQNEQHPLSPPSSSSSSSSPSSSSPPPNPFSCHPCHSIPLPQTHNQLRHRPIPRWSELARWRGGFGIDEDGEAGKALPWFPRLNFLNWKSFFFFNLIKLMFICLFILKFLT